MKGKTQIQWGALLVAVLYVNYVVYDNFFRPPPEPFWGKSGQSFRGPASAHPDAPATKLDLPAFDVFEDYFLHNTYNGFVNYEMDVDFWSDKGDRYFKKKVAKAVDEGLKESFSEIFKSNNKEITLPSTAKKHIVSKMIKQFVYTIKAYKLIDANFEIDLIFSPKNNRFNSYANELQSNQLVNLENKGNLLQELNSDNNTLPKKVLGAKIPSSGHIYQYVGGAITIATELLDTSWTLKKPIPDPKKNAVKGFLRLRKYYRVNKPGELELEKLFSDKGFNVKSTHFKKEEGFDTPFITVDVIYKFNLDKLMPEKEKIEIHLGELVSLDKSHDNIIKKIFSAFKKSNDVQTADFIITGEKSIRNNKLKFQTQIRKLTYNFKKEKFQFSNSSVRTRTNNTSQDTSRLRYDVKRSLLKKGQEDLIKALKLDILFKSERI